jgi:hypothetical protein
MADGEDSGTWGDNTNTNWNLIEQATVGIQTITMSNSSYTLSNLNGASDEARNAILIVQGTNSAVYSVIAPLVPKIYTISNQTTGGYAITISATGGTQSVNIPNGATTQVYCDGDDGFFFLSSSSGGSFLVPGNFSTAGTGAILGPTALGSTLAVTGTTALGNTLSVVGATTLGSTASIAGVATLAGGGTSLTPTTTDNSTNIATTAYVKNNITALSLGTMATQNANAVAITGGTITGTYGLNTTGNAATATLATNATSATNATNVVSGGTIASTVTATTQTAGDNSTKVATTQYVGTAVFNATSSLGTMSTQNANAVAITGGTINGTPIGATTPSTVTATNHIGPGTGLTGTAAGLSIGGNAATATSATTAATASNALAFNGKTKLGLGITGETWNNVTGSRGFNTTYTNSTGYAIAVSATGTADSYSALTGYVNGVLVSEYYWQFNGPGAHGGCFMIVPTGATYQINASVGVQNWAELY